MKGDQMSDDFDTERRDDVLFVAVIFGPLLVWLIAELAGYL